MEEEKSLGIGKRLTWVRYSLGLTLHKMESVTGILFGTLSKREGSVSNNVNLEQELKREMESYYKITFGEFADAAKVLHKLKQEISCLERTK